MTNIECPWLTEQLDPEINKLVTEHFNQVGVIIETNNRASFHKFCECSSQSILKISNANNSLQCRKRILFGKEFLCIHCPGHQDPNINNFGLKLFSCNEQGIIQDVVHGPLILYVRDYDIDQQMFQQILSLYNT